MKNRVVISWPCTKGSVCWAKWRFFSRLASNEITNLWVKLYVGQNGDFLVA
jgi:hypothetical protein